MSLLWRLCSPLKIYIKTISGQQNLPAGPFIVAANHASPLDVPLLMLALKRRIVFIAGRHLLEKRNLAWPYHYLVIFKIGKSIPTGQDCLKKCQATLKDSQTIGIFPEGEIYPTLRQNRIHTGVAVLSHQTQLPIIPIGISGAGSIIPIYPLWKFKFWRWHSVTISISQPILPPPSNKNVSRQTYQQMSNELMATINHLTLH